MNRSAMLTGATATQQCFSTGTNYGGLLPADLDGARLPARIDAADPTGYAARKRANVAANARRRALDLTENPAERELLLERLG